MRGASVSVLFILGFVGAFGPFITVWLNQDSTQAVIYSAFQLRLCESTTQGLAVTVSLGGDHRFQPGLTIVPMPDFEVNEPPFVGTNERWTNVRESSLPIGMLCFLIWIPATCVMYWACARSETARLAASNTGGACHQCGYDLEGNESGLCSECGSAVRSIEIHAVCSRCNMEFCMPLADWRRSGAACERCATSFARVLRRNNARVRNERMPRASLVTASFAMFPGTSMPFVGVAVAVVALVLAAIGRSRITRFPNRYGGREFVATSLPLAIGAVVLSVAGTAMVMTL